MVKKIPPLFFISLFLIFPLSPVFSAPAEGGNSPASLTQRVTDLEKQLGQIEARQNEIIISNQKIRGMVEELRVWAHRKPKLVNR